MKQSSYIFGALIIAFIVYITIRDQLPGYLALFSSASVADKGNQEPAESTPNVDKSFGSNAPIPDFLKPGLDKILGDVFSNAGFI